MRLSGWRTRKTIPRPESDPESLLSDAVDSLVWNTLDGVDLPWWSAPNHLRPLPSMTLTQTKRPSSQSAVNPPGVLPVHGPGQSITIVHPRHDPPFRPGGGVEEHQERANLPSARRRPIVAQKVVDSLVTWFALTSVAQS